MQRDKGHSSPIRILNTSTSATVDNKTVTSSIDLRSKDDTALMPGSYRNSNEIDDQEDYSPDSNALLSEALMRAQDQNHNIRCQSASQVPSSIGSTSEGSGPEEDLETSFHDEDNAETDGEMEAYEINSDPNWHAFKDVMIHVPSFEQAGITVIKPAAATSSIYTRDSTPTPQDDHDEENSLSKAPMLPKHTTEYAIQIKERKIYFSKPNTKPNSATLKAVNILSEMNRFARKRRALYLVSHLDQVTLLNQHDHILCDDGFQLKLYNKNHKTGLMDLLLEGEKLKQTLQACGIRELLKKKKPCRLDISASHLEILEKAFTKKASLFVTTDAKWEDSSIISETAPQFILKITDKHKSILHRDLNGKLAALKIKPENITQLIQSTFGKSYDFNSQSNTAIPLTDYQLEKLEQCVELANRKLYVGTALPAEEEKHPCAYYLINKSIALKSAPSSQETKETASDLTTEQTQAKKKKKLKNSKQVTLELYYRNANNHPILVSIEPNELTRIVHDLGLDEKLKDTRSTIIPLSYERTEQLERTIKSHTAMTAYNDVRKDEVYVSMPEIGLYAQPWLSNVTKSISETPSLHGFTRFYTVGCLFGSTLKGTDKKGRKFPLIKHDGIIYRDNLDNEDKIASISFNPRAENPYEAMLFNEQRKIAKFINMYSDQSSTAEKPVLTYHLPFLDYILFGLSLLAIGCIARDASNNISFDVLENLFLTTFNQKNKHIVAIQKIFSHAGIDVQFESPFDNLLDTKELDAELKNITDKIAKREKVPKYAFTKTILKMLNLLDLTRSEGKNIAVLFNSEKELTDHLVNLLQTSNFKPKHKKCWIEFIEATDQYHQSQAVKLEDLVKTANECCETIANANDDVKIKETAQAKYKKTLQQLHEMLKPLAISQFEKIKLTELYTNVLSSGGSNLDELKAFGLERLHTNTLEDLFKIGNSAMLGIATQYCEKSYDVCSILPTSEKQIQLNYAKLFDYLPESKDTSCQPTVNITFLPTAICADQTNIQNAGLMFYYDGEQAESLARVITRLRTATDNNLFVHSMQKSKKYDDISSLSISLEAALSSNESSPQFAGRKSPITESNEPIQTIHISPKKL